MGGLATDGVSVDTDDLEFFVETGRQYAASLDELLDEVRRLRWEVVSEVGSAADIPGGAREGVGVPALHHLIGEVRGNNAFVAKLAQVMGSGGAESMVACQPISSQLCPSTNHDRNQALAAMVAGLAPDEVEVHWSNFPPEYRRFHALSRHIDEAEQQRDAADGSWWRWGDGDEATVAAIDRQLQTMGQEQEELATELGMLSDAGPVDRLSAIAAISDTTEGFQWEGEIYADHFVGFHETRIFDGRWPLNVADGAIKDPSGNDVELRHIGSRLAASPEAAVAFYNGIGVGRTADLPTFLVGNGLTTAEFNRYSHALAIASVLVTEGSPALNFSGEELIAHPRRDTRDGVVWYNPALLFSVAEFEPEFLVEATVAVLRQSEADDVRGRLSHKGHQFAGPITMTFNGGEDPRNIMLDSAARHPEAARQVVEALVATQGKEWQAGPRSGSLDPLLKPRHPFTATVGPAYDRYWLEEVFDFANIADPSDGSISEVAYPALASEYPATDFLAAVAEQDQLSRWILRYTSDSVNASGPMVKDPGIAAGLDLILARHATLMFDPADLTAVGIERTTLNQGAVAPVEAKHWKAVHGEVLRFGRGQSLAYTTDQLLDQAIVGSVNADGHIDGNPLEPIAHMTARIGIETYDALFDYSAQLDEEARTKNTQINTAVSAALGIAGAATGPVGGALASMADVGWTAFFRGYPAHAEVGELRQYVTGERRSWREGRWKDLAATRWLELQIDAGSSERPAEVSMLVPGYGWQRVAIRRIGEASDGDDGYEWHHPETKEWQPMLLPTHRDFVHRFPIQSDRLPGELPTTVASIEQVVGVAFRSGMPSAEGLAGIEVTVGPERSSEDDWSGDWSDHWIGERR